MEHALHLVDLVDEKGGIVGAKPRQQIQKQTDLYNTVFTLLITPQKQVVLSKIPERSDLPNVYAGLLGCTIATIRRHAETADEASVRSVKNELYLEGTLPIRLGEFFQLLSDGRRQYMSIYCLVHTIPNNYSHTDIESLKLFAHQEIVDELNTNRTNFTPTFLAVWDKYNQVLTQF